MSAALISAGLSVAKSMADSKAERDSSAAEKNKQEEAAAEKKRQEKAAAATAANQAAADARSPSAILRKMTVSQQQNAFPPKVG